MADTIDIFSPYYKIDLCSCYFPEEPFPEDFEEQCRRYWAGGRAFGETVMRKIGNTWYEIETKCDGSERLTDKLHRMIFSEKGAIC